MILNRKGGDHVIAVRGDCIGCIGGPGGLRAHFITVLSSASTIAVPEEPAECTSLEDVETPSSSSMSDTSGDSIDPAIDPTIGG